MSTTLSRSLSISPSTDICRYQIQSVIVCARLPRTTQRSSTAVTANDLLELWRLHRRTRTFINGLIQRHRHAGCCEEGPYVGRVPRWLLDVLQPRRRGSGAEADSLLQRPPVDISGHRSNPAVLTGRNHQIEANNTIPLCRGRGFWHILLAGARCVLALCTPVVASPAVRVGSQRHVLADGCTHRQHGARIHQCISSAADLRHET